MQHNSVVKHDRGTDKLSCGGVGCVMLVGNHHPVTAIRQPPFTLKAYNFRSKPNFSCSSTSSVPSRLKYTAIVLTKNGSLYSLFSIMRRDATLGLITACRKLFSE